MLGFMPYRYRLLAKIAVMVLCLAAIPSCDTWDQARADTSAAVIDDQIVATEKVLADPQATPEAKADAKERHEFWLKLAASLAEANKGHADDTKAQHPEDAVAGALAPLAGPYAPIVAFAIPSIFAAFRELGWGKRLKQITDGIAYGRAKSAKLDEGFREAKDAIHARMDEKTIALIEKARVA